MAGLQSSTVDTIWLAGDPLDVGGGEQDDVLDRDDVDRVEIGTRPIGGEIRRWSMMAREYGDRDGEIGNAASE